MMQIQQPSSIDLLHGETVYMSSIPCLRRYNRKHKPKFQEKHFLYVTNYRLAFLGPVHKVFPMEIFIRDIARPYKHQYKGKGEQYWLYQLWRVVRDGSSEEKEEMDVLRFQNDDIKVLDKIDKYINTLIQKNINESEIDVKMRMLVSDKVRYGVYMNLVHNLSLITEEEFWERHSFIEANRIDQKVIFDKLQHQQKPTLVQMKVEGGEESLPGREINPSSLQGYNLRKDIENMALKDKSEEINDQTKSKIVKQIEDMYLRDSSAYRHLRLTEPEDLTNEGIFLAKVRNHMELQQTKDNTPIRLPGVKIPETSQVKFRIKNQQITKQIESSDAGIKYRKRMEAPNSETKQKQKQLTKKVVEYVRLFYLCMSKKDNETVGKMEKEIQKLKREVEEFPALDHGKELATFINKSLANCMNHRKGDFHM